MRKVHVDNLHNSVVNPCNIMDLHLANFDFVLVLAIKVENFSKPTLILFCFLNAVLSISKPHVVSYLSVKLLRLPYFRLNERNLFNNLLLSKRAKQKAETDVVWLHVLKYFTSGTILC